MSIENFQINKTVDENLLALPVGAFEALGTTYYVMPWVGGKELQKSAPAPGAITESKYGSRLVGAVITGDTSRLSLLNKADKYGRTPLYRANQGDPTECARVIRAAGGK